MKERALRPDRQHLVGRRAERQPHRASRRTRAPRRARSASRGRPRTSSGRSGSPSTRSRPASCCRIRRRSRSGRATAPTGSAACSTRSRRDGSARPRTSRTACSSSSSDESVVGDRPGALDRWRTFHLLSVCARRWPSSSRSRASASTRREPATCARAADWLAAQLAFANGRVVETDGHPVVLGERIVARRGTDRPRVRALRRAAAGRRVGVADAAVRAEHPRRPPLRHAARPTTKARCVVALEASRATAPA